MPTVVVRFEPNKKNPERGTIYYRIYKGHNRRMEFSSRLHLSASSWMKQQGQSGMIILSPVVSVSKLRRIFGF